MREPQLIISEQDHNLLQRAYVVRHPSELEGDEPFLQRVPADAQVLSVLAVYDVELPRAQWIHCRDCGKRRNHRHGFVAQFDVGRATIGRNCAENKHALKYEDFLAAWEEDRSRADALCRLIKCCEWAPLIAKHLTTLSSCQPVADLARRREVFRLALPQVFAYLEKWPKGEIEARVWVVDDEAEKVRKARYERKVEAIARRLKMNIEDVSRSVVEAELAGDPDLSKEPLMMKRTKVVGHFEGAGLFRRLPRLPDLLADLTHRLAAWSAHVDGIETRRQSTSQMSKQVSYFEALLADAEECLASIDAAQAFFLGTNWTKLVRVLNRRPIIKALGQLEVVGHAIRLVGTKPATAANVITDVIDPVPRGPLARALRDQPGPEVACPELIREIA